jgi:hypothetical protein
MREYRFDRWRHQNSPIWDMPHVATMFRRKIPPVDCVAACLLSCAPIVAGITTRSEFYQRLDAREGILCFERPIHPLRLVPATLGTPHCLHRWTS